MEILNNAIDHSEGTEVKIYSEWTSKSLELMIGDNGIGIFKKIKNALDLKDQRESVLHSPKANSPQIRKIIPEREFFLLPVLLIISEYFRKDFIYKR
ncbi:MAG: hypothetical protein CM1200mP16_09240 [Nitrospina sp.]|nr:MAG: hypothetical protein CM1200mP16_09240 [Nitrospina sp.]